MAASEAMIVDAGGRDLRVSSPDRVIFPMTERSGAVTKLDIVRYYLAVGDGIMRALERRPTTLERWPKGVHPGIVVSTPEKGGGARRTRDTEDRRRVLVEVAPEVRERAVELYGRPEEGARALARYADEQLQFLIELLRGSVGYREERLRRLEALKASDAADSQARP
jgi:hypothetical protein